jgi:hypothetical protein
LRSGSVRRFVSLKNPDALLFLRCVAIRHHYSSSGKTRQALAGAYSPFQYLTFVFEASDKPRLMSGGLWISAFEAYLNGLRSILAQMDYIWFCNMGLGVKFNPYMIKSDTHIFEVCKFALRLNVTNHFLHSNL